MPSKSGSEISVIACYGANEGYMMPKLSIIIPIYNVAPYLNECIDSLMSQTFADFEALFVNDGSTDGSLGILESYAEKDSRIRIFSQPNRGVSAARNLALDNARGEWIAFLDGDDTIDSQWFEKVMRYERDDVDIIHVDAGYCFNARRPADSCDYRTFLRDGWSCLNFVRKNVIGDLRYKERMRFKEDVVFFTALALKTSRIAVAGEKGYNYRKREGSAISVNITDEDCVRFFKEIMRLELPRDDFGRAVGYDLILWVKGRDWHNGYNAHSCPILSFWREGIESGRLKSSDVRWWWRPGLRRWLKTGDLSSLKKMLDFRIKAECVIRGRGIK